MACRKYESHYQNDLKRGSLTKMLKEDIFNSYSEIVILILHIPDFHLAANPMNKSCSRFFEKMGKIVSLLLTAIKYR